MNNDSSESKFTTIVEQKLNDDGDVSLDDADRCFLCGSVEMGKFLEESKKEWKKIKRGLKRSLLLDRLKGAKRIDSLEYSIEVANNLKDQSFNNYQMLIDYAESSFGSPSIDALRIYFAFKGYCDAYDNAAMDFTKSIFNRQTNRGLVPILIDKEDEIGAIQESGRDLVEHVSQIVSVNKDDAKRLVR